MLKISIQKMMKNKWMVLCLLSGLIISIAMICSVPMYSSSMLNRMLEKDLSEFQKKNKIYPGSYIINRGMLSEEQSSIDVIYKDVNAKADSIFNSIGPKLLSEYSQLSVENLFQRVDGKYEQVTRRDKSKIEAISDFDKHIKLVSGRLYSNKKNADGIYEVIVSEAAMKEMDIELDKVYPMGYEQQNNLVNIKVVGVYGLKDVKDPYWLENDYIKANSFMMDQKLFMDELLKKDKMFLNNIKWYGALDHRYFNSESISNFNSKVTKNKDELNVKFYTKQMVPVFELIEGYKVKADQFKLVFLILQTPLILMLIFYIFMVSNLIVDRDKNEIAVFRSRGANRLQVYKIYLTQGVLIGLVAILIGVPLGKFIAMAIGASSGFLQFVDRGLLEVKITLKDILYAFTVSVIFIATMMMAVVSSSKISVVQHKQKKARKSSKPLWKKLYLDFIMLAMSLYVLYNYSRQQKFLKATNIGNVPIEPNLYIASTLFVIALGLIFLRIFPYIVKAILWLGRKLWSPSTYISLVNVGRGQGGHQFIMLFLILTLSIGIFNVKSARTVITNLENNTRYSVGADLTITPIWKNSESNMNAENNSGKAIVYYEPPYQQYASLKGGEAATKVLNEKDANFTVGTSSGHSIEIQGIIPHEFGKIAWFDSSLLKYHWYSYLNIMTKNPRVVLLSSSAQKIYGVKKGDIINIRLPHATVFEGIIYDFIDYWPGYVAEKNKYFAVVNLNYIQQVLSTQPYDIWVKKSASINATEQLYKDMNDKKLSIAKVSDSSQKIIIKENEAMVQGTIGILSISFIASMLITIIGFLIYWILSIKNRTLQFGVLRAMGLTFRNLLSMLGFEQLLISGFAIIMGIAIGNLSSNIFVPLLKVMGSNNDYPLPFRVIAFTSDYLRFAAILSTMILTCFIIISIFISKIKIGQAIKLGED